MTSADVEKIKATIRGELRRWLESECVVLTPEQQQAAADALDAYQALLKAQPEPLCIPPVQTEGVIVCTFDTGLPDAD